MEPTATVGLIAAGMDSPISEIQDFDRVMQLHWARVLRFITISVRDRELAENLTQDCFWSAYKSRSSFRGESSLNTWLMRIAVNAVRKHLRNRRLQFWREVQTSAVDVRAICDALPDRRTSPEERAVIEEQVGAIWQATASLSDRQRTVFLLRFMEDMSPFEIAEATGMSEGAINVHLFRAVRAVRKLIRSTP
jgi:RNA polymerase sigma-70 factor (ECF subfamily)